MVRASGLRLATHGPLRSVAELHLVRWPLGAVVAVEPELAAPQLADREEVALVALVVAGPELDVRAGAAVGRRHPADAVEAVAHLARRRDLGVGDAVDRRARRVVGERDDDVACLASEARLEALHHRLVV